MRSLVKFAKLTYYGRRAGKFLGMAAVGFGIGYYLFKKT